MLLLNFRCLLQAMITAGLFLAWSTAVATEFSLDTNNPYPADDGLCALVEAIDNANDDAPTHPDCPAGSGADEIFLGMTVILDGSELFPASSPVFFDSGNSGLPEITSEITLRQGAITRTGDQEFRFFVVQSTGFLKLEDVFLINGRAIGHCAFASGDSFAGCGGAIVVYQGELILNRSFLLNNGAVEIESADVPQGGAISLLGGTLTAISTRFAHNEAEFGGAIMAQVAAGDISDSLFESNSALTSGGAIYSKILSEFVIDGSTFTNNQVTSAVNTFNGGGAIDNAGSNSQLTVINSQFNANSAAYGGAINNFNASDAYIVNSVFSSNSANYGGAIRSEGSGATVNLYSGTLVENLAFEGAGILNGGGSSAANVFDTHIIGNEATFDGGGISSTGILNVNNSLLDSNSGNDGGGISIGSGSNQVVSVDSSRLSNNFAGLDGGGLHFEENPNVQPNTLTITNTTFDNNEADEGGGLYAEVVDVSISGSTFSRNTASNVGSGGGGGLHFRSFVVTGAEIDISNSTISANHANQGGGGIYLNGSALDAIISSSTIAGNTSNSSTAGEGIHSLVPKERAKIKDTILASNGDLNCFNSDFSGISDGGSNISSDASCGFADNGSGTGDGVDPLINPLSDNGGPTMTHSLDLASPAIDEGGGDCPNVDQREAGRIDNCDIGAFESGVGRPVLTLSVDQKTLFETDETVATLSVTLDNTAANARPVEVSVPLRVTGSASGVDIDYSLSNQNGLAEAPTGMIIPFSFSLAAGSSLTRTATITVIDDDRFEPDEQVEIEAVLNGFAGYSEGNSLTLTIISEDPDPIPEVRFKDGFELELPDS